MHNILIHYITKVFHDPYSSHLWQDEDVIILVNDWVDGVRDNVKSISVDGVELTKLNAKAHLLIMDIT